MGDLDAEAGSNATSFTRYYTCKDKYGPKIQDYLESHNLYRKNNIEEIKSKLQKDRFSRHASSIPKKEREQFIKGEMVKKINTLRAQRRTTASKCSSYIIW